jgi:hypothetical protein
LPAAPKCTCDDEDLFDIPSCPLHDVEDVESEWEDDKEDLVPATPVKKPSPPRDESERKDKARKTLDFEIVEIPECSCLDVWTGSDKRTNDYCEVHPDCYCEFVDEKFAYSVDCPYKEHGLLDSDGVTLLTTETLEKHSQGNTY